LPTPVSGGSNNYSQPPTPALSTLSVVHFNECSASIVPGLKLKRRGRSLYSNNSLFAWVERGCDPDPLSTQRIGRSEVARPHVFAERDLKSTSIAPRDYGRLL
jgi:hypothetical protein